MKRNGRRLLLSIAALSPGVASLAIQEFAFSLAMMFLGLTGTIALVVSAVVAPSFFATTKDTDAADPDGYHSLLRQNALDTQPGLPKPLVLRGHFLHFLSKKHEIPGFQTGDDLLRTVLSQVISRWQVQHVAELSDAQLRELWLTETILRASPTDALAMSKLYHAPQAMLAMRDRIAVALA